MLQRPVYAYHRPSGQIALAASAQAVQVWNIADSGRAGGAVAGGGASGRPADRTVTPSHGSIRAVGFADARTLVTVHASGLVAGWSLEHGGPGQARPAWTYELGVMLSLATCHSTGPNATLRNPGSAQPATRGAGLLIAAGGEAGAVFVLRVGPGGVEAVGRGLVHRDTPISFVFSDDGAQLASGARDRQIVVWSTALEAPPMGQGGGLPDRLFAPEAAPATLVAHHTLSGSNGWPLTLSFSHDRRRLVSGGMDNGVYVWELAAAQPLRATSFEHFGWLSDVAWAPGDAFVATASWDNSVGVFHSRGLHPRFRFTMHRDYCARVLFLPGTPLLVSAGYDQRVCVWAWDEGRLVRTLPGHGDWVGDLCWLGDGRFASVSSDRTIRVWSAEDFSCLDVLGTNVSAELGFGTLSRISEPELDAAARVVQVYSDDGFRASSTTGVGMAVLGHLDDGPVGGDASSTGDSGRASDGLADGGLVDDGLVDGGLVDSGLVDDGYPDVPRFDFVSDDGDDSHARDDGRAWLVQWEESHPDSVAGDVAPVSEDDRIANLVLDAISEVEELAAPWQPVVARHPVARHPVARRAAEPAARRAAAPVADDPEVMVFEPVSVEPLDLAAMSSPFASVAIDVEVDALDPVFAARGSDAGAAVDEPAAAPDPAAGAVSDADVTKHGEMKLDLHVLRERLAARRRASAEVLVVEPPRHEPAVAEPLRLEPPRLEPPRLERSTADETLADEAIVGEAVGGRTLLSMPGAAAGEPRTGAQGVDDPDETLRGETLLSFVRAALPVRDADELPPRREEPFASPAPGFVTTDEEPADDPVELGSVSTHVGLMVEATRPEEAGGDHDAIRAYFQSAGAAEGAARLSPGRSMHGEELVVPEIPPTRVRGAGEELSVIETTSSEIFEQGFVSAPGMGIMKRRMPARAEYHPLMYVSSSNVAGGRVAIAPGDRRFISGGHGEEVCVWHVRGEREHTFRVDAGGVQGVGFAADGNIAYALGADHRLHLWLLPRTAIGRSGRVRHAALSEHHGALTCSALHPSGRFLMTGGRDGLAVLWNLETGTCASVLDHGGALVGVGFGSKGPITAGEGGAIRIWSAHGFLLDQIDVTSQLTSFDCGQGRMCWTSATGAVHLMEEGGSRPRALVGHHGEARSVAFRVDGHFVTAGEDGRLFLYAPDDAQPFQEIQLPSSVTWVSITDRLLAAACEGGAVYLFRRGRR